MILTTLSEYAPAPGEVIEWTPVTTEALPDDRLLSHVQERHLLQAKRFESDDGASTSWLAIAYEIPEHAEEHALSAAFLALMRRHETLRSGFALHNGRFSRRTISREGVRLERTAGPSFTHTTTLVDYLNQRIAHTVNPLTRKVPLLFVAIVRAESATIVIASDHSQTDALSLFVTQRDFKDAYETAGTTIRARKTAASYIDFCHQERSQAELIDQSNPAVSIWKRFFHVSTAQKSFGFEFHNIDEMRMSVCREQVASDSLLDAFEQKSRELGGSRHGSLLAITIAVHALAVTEISETNVFCTTTPVHTRRAKHWADTVGWFTNLMPVSFSVPRSRDLSATAAAASAALRGSVSTRQIPHHRAWELAEISTLPRSMVSFMDLRHMGSAGTRQNDSPVIIGKPHVGEYWNLWFMLTHDGLEVSTTYPHSDRSRSVWSQYTTRLHKVFAQFHTPTLPLRE